MVEALTEPEVTERDAATSYAARKGEPRAQKTPESSYQSSLFAGAGTSDSPAWSDSTGGRMLIRLFSRGVVGAAFFVGGSRIAKWQLNGYNVTQPWDRSKPLQAIAKGIDLTLGKGIGKTIELFAGLKHGFGSEAAKEAAKRAITFRESRTFPYKVNGVTHTAIGRSYGADIVGFTFDFAMMSVGDALTRNIVQAFDPNVRQTWKVNDRGEIAKRGEQWHFVPSEFAKWSGKTAWRIFSKNQMEDWAAAIPYAFQMKFQRKWLSNAFSKRWNGHQVVFDQGWNGGAYRINQQGRIVGDYQLPGAIDLHLRFTGYNWYTLMFREGYDAIGRAFARWNKGEENPESANETRHSNPVAATLGGAWDAARYVTKSFIKANLYMNPACLFFWSFRVPQSKWVGRSYITDELRALGPDTNIWRSAEQMVSRPGEQILDPYAWSNYAHYPTATLFDRVEKRFSQLGNWVGMGSFKLGTKAADASDRLLGAQWAPRENSLLHHILNDPNNTVQTGRRRFAHEYVDAMISYTPYTIAKTEFGLRVDDNKGDGKRGKMDTAIYKLMDDVGGFKLRAVPGDIKKIWDLGTRFERELKMREGSEPGAQQTAQPATPRPTVHADSVQQAPTTLRRAADDRVANDEQFWAKRVAGSDINSAQIHRGSATVH